MLDYGEFDWGGHGVWIYIPVVTINSPGVWIYIPESVIKHCIPKLGLGSSRAAAVAVTAQVLSQATSFTFVIVRSGVGVFPFIKCRSCLPIPKLRNVDNIFHKWSSKRWLFISDYT